jgi:hypothetical protein
MRGIIEGNGFVIAASEALSPARRNGSKIGIAAIACAEKA